MSSKSTIALTAGMAALALSACGGDEQENAGAERKPQAPVVAEIRLKALTSAEGLAFDRKKVVTKSGRVRIVFENAAGRAHNVRIQTGPRPNGPGAKDIGGTPTIPGGQTGEGVVELEPGRYTYLSAIGQHWRQLHGTLIVR